METLELHERIVENKDWATILIVVILALIAITKFSFENRFNEFIRLIYTAKYLKVYKESSNVIDWFTGLLFIVQIFSFSFFIQLLLSYFGFTAKTDIITFVQIVTFLVFFILSKFLIGRIIATSFDIERLNEQINLQKVSYRTYIALFLFLIDIMLFYNKSLSIMIIYSLIAIILIVIILIYLLCLKDYQKIITDKLFYFILYLCTLEIAPYYFVYRWFTKS